MKRSLQSSSVGLGASVASPLGQGLVAECYALAVEGGHALMVFKGKGDRANIGNLRDITIADAMAKVAGKLLRGAVIAPIAELVGEGQFGAGLNEGCTAFVQLHARALTDVAATSLMPPACSVMCDQLSQASSDGSPSPRGRAIRCGPPGSQRSVSAPQKSRPSSGRSPQQSCGAERGASVHVLQLLVEHHENTWMSVEGSDGVVACQAGALAGTPLADLVFAAAFRRVLVRIKDQLAEEGLGWAIRDQGAAEQFDVLPFDSEAGSLTHLHPPHEGER